jgi:hypothetical protein
MPLANGYSAPTSAYLPEIQTAAIILLKIIYRPSYKYRKVMIALNALTSDTTPQLDLFDAPTP